MFHILLYTPGVPGVSSSCSSASRSSLSCRGWRNTIYPITQLKMTLTTEKCREIRSQVNYPVNLVLILSIGFWMRLNGALALDLKLLWPPSLFCVVRLSTCSCLVPRKSGNRENSFSRGAMSLEKMRISSTKMEDLLWNYSSPLVSINAIWSVSTSQKLGRELLKKRCWFSSGLFRVGLGFI